MGSRTACGRTGATPSAAPIRARPRRTRTRGLPTCSSVACSRRTRGAGIGARGPAASTRTSTGTRRRSRSHTRIRDDGRLSDPESEPSQALEQQAALREVAVLVAHGGPPGDVFGAISAQAARVCHVGGAAVVRFGESGSEVVGRWGNVVFGLSGALGLVRHTGLPARVEEAGAEVRESAAAP